MRLILLLFLLCTSLHAKNIWYEQGNGRKFEITIKNIQILNNGLRIYTDNQYLNGLWIDSNKTEVNVGLTKMELVNLLMELNSDTNRTLSISFKRTFDNFPEEEFEIKNIFILF